MSGITVGTRSGQPAEQQIDAVESRARSPPVQRCAAPGPSWRRAFHLMASLFAARPPRLVATYVDAAAARKGSELEIPQAARKSDVVERPLDVREVHPDRQRDDQPDVDGRDEQPVRGTHAVVVGVALLARLALLPAPVRLVPPEQRDQDQD